MPSPEGQVGASDFMSEPLSSAPPQGHSGFNLRVQSSGPVAKLGTSDFKNRKLRVSSTVQLPGAEVNFGTSDFQIRSH